MNRELIDQMESLGYRVRVVSIRRLKNLQEEFEAVYHQGLLNEEFYQERLAGFVLHAEKCITFWNEKPGTITFPAWLNDAPYDWLVGCMRRRRVCPENRRMLDWYEEGGEFTEEEINFLLKEPTSAELPAPPVKKLERWDMHEWLDIPPRNLNALLSERGSRSLEPESADEG